jgi:hypothetical protein
MSRKKKALIHPKANKQLRLEFEAKMKKYQSEGKFIVYIDESGFSHESIRSHGYSKIGERCFSQFNWGGGKGGQTPLELYLMDCY